MRSRFSIAAGSFLVLAVLAFSAPVFAQTSNTDCAKDTGGFVPLACFNKSPKLTDLYTEGDLANFLSKLFMGTIAIGAILAVLRLSWAGFVYMSSDLWSQKGHAKEIIQDTLLGLFLLLAIWLILNLINPDLLKLKVEAKKTAPTQQVQQPFGQDIDPNLFRTPTPAWVPSNAPPGSVTGVPGSSTFVP